MGNQRRRRRRKKKGCLETMLYALLWMLLLFCALYFYLKKDDIQTKVEEEPAPEIPYQEVEVSQEQTAQKYYYSQLTGEEQTAYQEILQGLNEQKDEIYLHFSDAGRTNEILAYVLKDEPGLFWCDGTATATYYEGKESYTVLEPVYQYPLEERQKMQVEIETRAGYALEGIDASASDYDKILYVFNYIVDTVDYDPGDKDNQNIYSVFVTKRSVCAGYSKAVQYLLEKLGVFCTYVTGKTTEGENHAWNLVMCDGQYYYVDATWGDPVFLSQEQMMDLNYVSYDYMCCDEKELFRTHIPDSDIVLPSCTSMSANYYVVNGMYYKSYDEQTALQKMNDTISKKENPTVFKFADSESYGKAKDSLFNGAISQAAQNLAALYGLSEVKYSYFDEDELNKIVIYWQYE